MILTVVVYVLFLFMLAFGGSFAGFGKEDFREDVMDTQTVRSLRGFAAVGVILHHISQQQALQDVGEMTLFVNAGYYFVAVFLFCSGYGLYVSLKNKPDYLDGFLRRRLKYILVPFYVTTAFYALCLLVSGVKLPAMQWVTGLLGLTTLNQFAWYPIVISLLYAAFHLFFRRSDGFGPITVMFLFVLLLGAVFCVEGHFAWWTGPQNWWMTGKEVPWWMGEKLWWFHGEWWVNSTLAFPLGIVFARNREKINAWLKKGYWVKLLLALFLWGFFRVLTKNVQASIGYWSEFSGKGPGIGDKFICWASQLPEIALFILSLYMALMKYRAVNAVGHFFGGISLESYLVNIVPIEGFRFLLYGKYGETLNRPGHRNMALYAAAVFAVTVLLGWLFHKLDNRLTGKKDLS